MSDPEPEVEAIVVHPEMAEMIRTVIPTETVETTGPFPCSVLNGKWRIYEDPVLEKDQILMVKTPKLAPIVPENAPEEPKGKSVLDTGYIYAPYVPLQVTPTFGQKPKPKKTPLQELFEGVFKEEIESGEIKPFWATEEAEKSFQDRIRERHSETMKSRFKKQLINPDFYGTVDVSNL